MRVVSLLLLILALCATPASADAFAASDLHPLLSVRETQRSVIPFDRLLLQDESHFIARGGAVLSSEVSQIDGGAFINVLVRGVGEPAQLAALKGVLVENRVGTLTSCEIAGGAETPEPYEVTWYGREGRRNTFVAVSGPAQSSGLPPCSPQIGLIIRAIRDYVNHVVNRPGTEVLVAR